MTLCLHRSNRGPCVPPWLARLGVPGVTSLLLLAPLDARADELSDAVVTRFEGCLSTEGGTLAPRERAVLASLAPQLLMALGDARCATGEGSGCTAALAEASCALLAGIWHTPIAEAAMEPPAWVAAVVGSLAERLTLCVGSEGADVPARITTWQTTAAVRMAAAVEAGRCVVNESALPACQAAIAGLDCAALAGALTPDSAIPLDGAAALPCAPLLGCPAQVEGSGAPASP